LVFFITLWSQGSYRVPKIPDLSRCRRRKVWINLYYLPNDDL